MACCSATFRLCVLDGGSGGLGHGRRGTSFGFIHEKCLNTEENIEINQRNKKNSEEWRMHHWSRMKEEEINPKKWLNCPRIGGKSRLNQSQVLSQLTLHHSTTTRERNGMIKTSLRPRKWNSTEEFLYNLSLLFRSWRDASHNCCHRISSFLSR